MGTTASTGTSGQDQLYNIPVASAKDGRFKAAVLAVIAKDNSKNSMDFVDKLLHGPIGYKQRIAACFGSLRGLATALAEHALPVFRRRCPSAIESAVPSDAFLDFMLAIPQSDMHNLELELDHENKGKPCRCVYNNIEDFAKWMQSPCVQRMWDLAMNDILQSANQQQQSSSISPQTQRTTLMAIESIFALETAIASGGFPPSHQWHRIFSTTQQGSSWTVFQNAITDAESSLIVVREKHSGAVFGGFASVPWTHNPAFYGNASSFLFTLHSELNIFRPTGLNSNFQYFNSGKQTLPNGVGFGGQLDYFGLWISDDFEHGCSMAQPTSTTFGNTQLSTHQQFLIDAVEVWRVKEKEIDDRLIDPNDKSSILANPETTAFLEMAGKTFYSKQVAPMETLEHP